MLQNLVDAIWFQLQTNTLKGRGEKRGRNASAFFYVQDTTTKGSGVPTTSGTM